MTNVEQTTKQSAGITTVDTDRRVLCCSNGARHWQNRRGPYTCTATQTAGSNDAMSTLNLSPAFSPLCFHIYGLTYEIVRI